MDLKEIRSLVELMKKNGIAVFKLERQNFKISLKTNEATKSYALAPAALPIAPPAPSAPISSPPVAPILPPSPQPTPNETPGGLEIKSPMVGTFYAAPSPESPPFVKVGQTVTPETVVCIIEAMKVMNEVKAEVSGTITEICVENGRPVQFGQTLFRLQ